jgi:hypothetical protein
MGAGISAMSGGKRSSLSTQRQAPMVRPRKMMAGNSVLFFAGGRHSVRGSPMNSECAGRIIGTVPAAELSAVASLNMGENSACGGAMFSGP